MRVISSEFHFCLRLILTVQKQLTGVDPLKIYIYDEGLVRFAVNDFSMNPDVIKDNRIHVTNFDVNKAIINNSFLVLFRQIE